MTGMKAARSIVVACLVARVRNHGAKPWASKSGVSAGASGRPVLPKPLPNNWILGQVSGVAVDKRGRLDRAAAAIAERSRTWGAAEPAVEQVLPCGAAGDRVRSSRCRNWRFHRIVSSRRCSWSTASTTRCALWTARPTRSSAASDVRAALPVNFMSCTTSPWTRRGTSTRLKSTRVSVSKNSGECVRFLSATDQKSPASQFFRDPARRARRRSARRTFACASRLRAPHVCVRLVVRR